MIIDKHVGIALWWIGESERTRYFAKLLKLHDIGVKYSFKRVHPLLKSVFYIFALMKTLYILSKYKPQLLFIQVPPGLILLPAVFLKRIIRSILIVDTHTGFLVSYGVFGKLNNIFIKLLSSVDIIIAHNRVMNLLIKDIYSNTSYVITIYDYPYEISCNKYKSQIRDEVRRPLIVLFPSGGGRDEPLKQLVKTWIKEIPAEYAILKITGRYKRRMVANIIFTGFLNKEKYYEELCNSDIILALTTREFTTLRALWEAIYAEKIPIYGFNKTLRIEFEDIGFYVNNVHEIITNILRLFRNRTLIKEYTRKIRERKNAYIKITNSQVKNMFELLKSIIKSKIK